MKTPVSESVAQLMTLVDPKGYTAEQFCAAVRDQPVPSGLYHGCNSSEDIAAHWLKLAEEGRLAVYRAGYEDGKTGEFQAFDIPWVYDARSEFVASNSVDLLREKFEHKDMTPRHWGVTAEREMEAGKFSDLTLPEVLYRWASAAAKGNLRVEFETVIPGNPYDSRVHVTMT